MATNDQCPILNLPQELLFEIASFASDFDVLNLRLAHRRLYDASSDRFGESYLSSVNCSFLEPTRLFRVHQITARPHLAHKIKRLKITIDLFEWHAGHIAYECTANKDAHTRTTSINWLLAKCILENIKHVTGCQLLLQAETDTIHQYVGQYGYYFVENFRTLSLRVGRLVDAIQVTHQNFLHAAKYRKGGALWPAIQNLVSLEHSSQEPLDGDRPWKVDKAHIKLQWPRFLAKWHIRFLPDRFQALKTLRLLDDLMECDILCTLLSRCPATLVTLQWIHSWAIVFDDRHYDPTRDKDKNINHPWLGLFHQLLQSRGQRMVSPDDVFTGCIEHDKCDQRAHVSDPEDGDFKWGSVTHEWAVGRPVLEYYLGNGFTLLRWLYEGELEDMLEEGLEEDLDEGSDDALEQDSEDAEEVDSEEDVEEDDEEDSDENVEVD